MSNINPTHHIIHSHNTLQNISAPDINLDRDVVLLGEEVSELAAQRSTDQRSKNQKESKNDRDTRFRINIATIIISALLFLMILSFFDALQTAFFQVLISSKASEDIIKPSVKFFYFILLTVFISSSIGLIYYYNQDIL